jgi:hypothetical protein
MNQYWFYRLIISGILLVIAAVNIHAKQKNDDIWKQIPDAQPAYSSNRVSAPINPKNKDKSNIEVLKFDSTAINDYLADSDFLYDRPQITTESLLERFKHRLRRWLDDLFGGGNANIDWTDRLFYALAVVIIAFVIARLTGLQLQLFIRKKGQTPQEFIIGDENIYAIEFEKAIAKAEAKGDFRYAIRLHYLQLLKVLADKGLIRWLLQKTNTQYVAEMSQSSFGEDFAALTRSFAYIWYGHFEVTPVVYNTFKEKQQAIVAGVAQKQTVKV